jgi:hypothetical protein
MIRLSAAAGEARQLRRVLIDCRAGSLFSNTFARIAFSISVLAGAA